MDPPLIVGAGPTGLAAALFLAERGVEARIVDKAEVPSEQSKALAVNPRTLELLEPTGVTARILAEGRPVRRMELRRAGRTVLALQVSDLHPRFPMVVLPQARTETLLTEALAARGLAPDRGAALEAADQAGERVLATLARADGRREHIQAPLLLAADGAHSTVRVALKLAFPGSTLPEPWQLADIEFEAPPDPSEGYLDLYPHGLVFALAFEPTHWRYISTVGDPLERLPRRARVKAVSWRSQFHISHRMVERMAVGRVGLGGDAAHLHSPLGARGMNLGIEDAYVFAAVASDALQRASDAEVSARLADYGRLRYATDRKVVRRIQAMTRVMSGEGGWGLLRAVGTRLMSAAPPLQSLLMRTAAGLDHPVRLS